MADLCPDCGRRITESHKAFTEQWERAGSEELCFPHVNFGGTELCVERTVELLSARVAKLERWRFLAVELAGAVRDHGDCEGCAALLAEIRQAVEAERVVDERTAECAPQEVKADG